MKKGLLLAVLAMLASVTLIGCGQKSEEQPTDDSSNTVATEEQKTEENSDEQKNEEKKDENDQSIDLGEQTIEGESVEGTIYGTGKYRLTKGSDRVVAVWVKDTTKTKIEYIFDNGKLSAVKVETSYENEDQAKGMYDSVIKNPNATKGLKDFKLEGKSVKYEAEESQWSDIKDYTKDQIFDEQKKALEELSKVDDIRSDD